MKSSGTNSISRRNFLNLAGATAAGAMLAITLRPNRSQAAGLVAAPGQILKSTVSNNHGHAFVAPLSTFLTNGPTSYSIQGQSGHPHNVDITQAILDMLKQTPIVEVESSVDFGHNHIVRFEIV
jgi:hypothetical protein